MIVYESLTMIGPNERSSPNGMLVRLFLKKPLLTSFSIGMGRNFGIPGSPGTCALEQQQGKEQMAPSSADNETW